jgi:LysM repeat protein
MPRRSSARWLAPLALVACTAAVVAVVGGAGGGDGGDSTAGKPAASTTKTRTTADHKRVRSTYTVRSGDVLSGIAQQTGVPVETIMQLNPNVDAQTLRPGQRLRLRR